MNSLCCHLRAIHRAIGFCLVTALVYGLWAIVTPFLLPSKRASYWWRKLNFRVWAKLVTALLKIRISARGISPQAPFFLVSNHLSYIDVLVFASQVDCLFIAKSEVARWPVLGFLCRSMGTIFVDRNSRADVLRVNRLVQQAMRDGKSVLLFPEGTSTVGAEVLPFHSALLEPPVQLGCPVSFATVSYRTLAGDSPAHLSVCWWGEMLFLPHLYRLLQLKSVEARLLFGSHSIRADDRKLLASMLWEAVGARFTPVVRDARSVQDQRLAMNCLSLHKAGLRRGPHNNYFLNSAAYLGRSSTQQCKTLTH